MKFKNFGEVTSYNSTLQCFIVECSKTTISYYLDARLCDISGTYPTIGDYLAFKVNNDEIETFQLI